MSTGASALAATGPINLKSTGTTLYNFGDGKVSSASGTVTNGAVDRITASTSLYQGTTRLQVKEAISKNTHYVMAYSSEFNRLIPYQYSAKGYHTVTHKGVFYSHSTTNPK